MKHVAAFMSTSEDWETPEEVFNFWNHEYEFNLDAAASADNARCSLFFTKEQDALRHPWVGNVWLNPPYSHGIGKWLQKAHDEVTKGNAEHVVCLIPARTDTAWWHDYVMKSDHIWLIRGRLRFSGSSINAPFPSCIVVFKSGWSDPWELRPKFFGWDWKKKVSEQR